MRSVKGAFTLAPVALAIAACSVGETNYETITFPVREAKVTRTCDSPFIVPDLAKAKPCGNDGKSHCWPWSKSDVPKEELEPCDDPAEICMPDRLLLAGGKRAKECKWSGNEPGGCMPLAFKQLAKNAGALQTDVCEDDEKCAPCINPVDKTDTGACSPAGVHEKDCVGGAGDAAEVETCCARQGVCADEKGLPEDARGQMQSLGCSSGKLCTPAAMFDGKAKKCETIAGFDGACLPKCFAPMLRGIEGLSSDCNAFEICLPCVLAEGQGMPGCEG